MNEKDVIPNEEHLEAFQYYLDKSRYEFVDKLTPEEKAAFQQMEKAVEVLIGMKKPFVLLAAPTNNENQFWRYQKYSQLPTPGDSEEMKRVSRRAWYALEAHASHWAYMMGYKVEFQDKDGKPFYVCTPEGSRHIENP
jgi:hypothetical protein